MTRHSESRSLLLQGEARIEKRRCWNTWSPPDLTVVRAGAVELEMKMDYARLQQLCGPLPDKLEMIPARQRQPIGVVLGSSAGEPPDRFLLEQAGVARTRTVASTAAQVSRSAAALPL